MNGIKKILVTGATGFIGNYIINELLKKDNLIIASSVHENKARALPWFDKVQFIPFDLNTMEDKNYFDFFQNPDIMIHLAWEGLPNYKSSHHIKQNLPRHTRFLRNMIEQGLADLTVTGTCFEYGMQEGRLSEDMLADPKNSYAIAKNELRKELELLQAATNFSFKWVRLFYMYGNGQNPNSLLSQLDDALAEDREVFNMSGGEQTRDYLSVEKVAEYISQIALQNKVTGIINCCSGKPVTIKQFVQDYLAIKKKNIKLNLGYYPYTDFEPMHFWGDNQKLKSITENE
jgi:nucleoside-diphosphate-sugar epimerase